MLSSLNTHTLLQKLKSLILKASYANLTAVKKSKLQSTYWRLNTVKGKHRTRARLILTKTNKQKKGEIELMIC